MEITPLTVDYYWTPEGRCPVREWRDGIRSEETVDIIDGRIARVRRGLLGHCDSIGGGLQGLKIDVGPGFRIYFGRKGTHLVFLLSAGDKSTQKADIKKAHEYWEDHQRRKL